MGKCVLIADDHPLFRDALAVAVGRADPAAEITEASSVSEALAAAHSMPRLDLILLDLWMPDSQGFYGLAQVRTEFPEVPVLVVTAAAQPTVEARALDYGAAGFIPKSSSLPDIEKAITTVLNGGSLANDQARLVQLAVDPQAEIAKRITTLTPAQLKVLQSVLLGRLNKQIAHDMAISEATVKAHMTAVFRKLGVFNRTQAVLAASALKMEDPAQLVDRPN